MSAPKTTPMLQQYLSIKASYKDTILFYRMGDFYEMFFEDAKVASKELEITLTSRNKNDSSPVPMCGVPYRAAQSYIARLIERGHKVAICDQVEDPATAKGLVKREVVRVVTPGMIVENELLDAKSNNYLLSLTIGKNKIGIAYLDISTGLFRVAETDQPRKIVAEVQQISPKEILLPDGMQGEDVIRDIVKAFDERTINWLDASRFEVAGGRKRLIEQFKTRSLEGFGCHHMTSGLGAGGALLFYVQETQKQSVSHLRRIESYHLEEHLVVDHMSRQNLELEVNLRTGSRRGTLISILDQTKTAMGGRKLKHWLRYPLLQVQRIGDRLDAVEEGLIQGDIRHRLMENLAAVYDLERLNSKIVMGHANARDLLALGKSLSALPDIWKLLGEFRSALFKIQLAVDELASLGDLIGRAVREDAPPTISEGGMIRTGYHAPLDELIEMSKNAKGYLAQLEGREREATGINTLKVRFNKVFGYYIEVSKAQTRQVPDRYVRKQTLVNAERYITDELKQFETKVLGAEEKRCALELELFNRIRNEVKDNSDHLQATARFLARIDCLLSLAEVADQNDYCRPRINTLGKIHIEEGRHPVVEKMIQGERFVPNSVLLDDDANQILVITGPNMAGKSTALRQVSLLVLMAQMGSFVPAEAADISVTDRIFTRVGALDNLSAGQSTFMVEMEETANILNNATSQSLVIMDEIGRGTSTYDGLSIAWAVVAFLHDLKGQGVKTLFATHYHELTELAESKPRVKNFNIAVKEWNDQIIFLRKLIPGGTNRSYGIQVARLAGIPETVVKEAKAVLERVENHAPADARMERGTGRSSGARTGHVQLELFKSYETETVAYLKAIDLNSITPLEALNLLQGLQEKIKKTD